MRTIRTIQKAVFEPIEDLDTYRAMPTSAVPMNELDPFIFLNHHGYQEYEPNNHGLPFGPHPHRGFETVTFILKGDLLHKDTSGGGSTIREGGIQWMTAGKGLIHAEVSSDEFKKYGGPLEILQLWVNLPAAQKMTEPKYTGLQENEIPIVDEDGGKVRIQAVAGKWRDMPGAVETLYPLQLALITSDENSVFEYEIPAEENILFYVISGKLEVNGKNVSKHGLVIFNNDEGSIHIKAGENSLLLFGHAKPFNEPFFAYGPFVMNTREEIQQAYTDYNKGKMGDPNKF